MTPEIVDSPSQPKSTSLSNLHPRHANAVQLKFQEKSYEEIAKLVGAKRQTVRTWFMSGGLLYDVYNKYCNELLNPSQSEIMDVQSKIKDHAHRAIDRMGQLIHADSEDVSFRASKDILDRAGHGPVEKSASIHALMDMDADELNDAFGKLIADSSNSGPNSGSSNNSKSTKVDPDINSSSTVNEPNSQPNNDENGSGTP